MWKVLSGIAALFLLISAILAYMNHELYRTEKAKVNTAETRRSQAEGRKAEAENAKSGADNELVQLTSSRDDAQAKLAELKTTLEESNESLAAKETELAGVQESLQALKTEIEKIGDIKVVQATLAQLTTTINEYDEKIATLKNIQAITSEEMTNTGNTIERYAQLVSNQNSGKMPAIRTSVKTVYGDWGFVVINAGNRQGVVRQATLDIVRGGSIIAKAVVTQVEQGVSVANILKDSQAAGVSVQVGDVVTVSADSTAAP